MIRPIALLAALAGALCLASAEKKEIFLPADCDITIIGQGFKLDLTQLKENWQQVHEASEQVERPRRANDDIGAVINAGLYERTKKGAEGGQEPADYGVVSQELLEWLNSRATSLVNRIERYRDEMAALDSGNRIVNEILLLNTYVDIENLQKESIPPLKWLRTKLQGPLARTIARENFVQEILGFANKLMDGTTKEESRIKGTNKPTETWLREVQALRRVLHEQRFSEELSKRIVNFLSDKFSLMKRSILFDKHKPRQRLEDGLFYAGAKGRVPLTFPFPSQDAIVNGAYV